MHLHIRRFAAPLLAAALLAVGAAPAAAQPTGTQNPLGALTGGVTTAERPAIAYGEGRSLVVWKEQSISFDFPKGPKRLLFSAWTINGRFIDGNADPIGDPFFIGIGADLGDVPSRPDVTYNDAVNEWLVTWRGSSKVQGFDGVVAQRISLTGDLLSETPVEVNSDDECLLEYVARPSWAPGENNGTYLVVWDDRECGNGIHGVRLRGTDASVIDTEELGSLELSENLSDEQYPDVAHDPATHKWFVVFTASEFDRGGCCEALYGTTVGLDGTIEGPARYSDARAQRVSIANNSVDGGFAVVWGHQSRDVRVFSNFRDGDIVGQLFTGDGDAVGDVKQISPVEDGNDAGVPNIAHDSAANEYLVDWWQETNVLSRGSSFREAIARKVSKALDPLDDPRPLSILGPFEFRGVDDTVFNAAQPVVAYDRSTCTYVNAFETQTQQRVNVSSRGYDAPDCPKPLNGADSPIRPPEQAPLQIVRSSIQCKSTRRFQIRLVQRRGRRYRSATVTVNGRRVATLSAGRTQATVDLRGLAPGVYNVALNAKLTNGRTLRYTRRYRTCQTKLPPSNRLESRNAV